ncbi:helix-turn-helix domain-containing protein [Paraburkholderia sp. CNPSo 3157]|uniref:Helix-turn-helix domain-containing protein n=1 Tax=Paraburkholderia franconis TaxID=2654983 RepID=A0A7X1NIG6_9BURK|nr:helix-turn-helix domain-containing protein [Paraburkholderia franconis]MPW22118.1 helix-turn-helix domain-containing protein [Paraburkholderia franconis]
MSTRPRQRLDANESEPLRTRHVAVVLFEGFDLLSASVIANTLELASELSSRSSIQWAYRVAVLAAHDGHVGSSATLLVSTEAFDTRRDYEFDAIFAIVGADTDLDDRSEPLTAWIGRARAKAADVRLVGAPLPGPDSPICDGPRATHHESSCNAAGHANDCKRKSQSLHEALTGALKLIRRDMGDTMARRVAEHLSICSQDALNAIFEDVVGSTPAEKVRAAAHWLQDNCRRQVTIEDAAQVAAMSERSLLRHFRSELGMTPSDYLMNARLQVVCNLLIETDLPVDKVAKRAGMTSGDHLARSFRRHMKTSPTEYRAQRKVQC